MKGADMETIKEKAMRAWLRDLDLVVDVIADNSLIGKIQQVPTSNNTGISVVDSHGESSFVLLKDIADIHFVGEGEDDSIVEKLGHALVHRYPVKVTFRPHPLVSETKTHTGEVDQIHRCVDDADSYVEFTDDAPLQVTLQSIRHVEIVYDKPSPPEPERWEVIHGEKGYYRLESTHGRRIALSDGIPLETAKAMAGATQMWDALKMVRGAALIQSIHDPHAHYCGFSEDQWRVITDALEKAGG